MLQTVPAIRKGAKGVFKASTETQKLSHKALLGRATEARVCSVVSFPALLSGSHILYRENNIQMPRINLLYVLVPKS